MQDAFALCYFDFPVLPADSGDYEVAFSKMLDFVDGLAFERRIIDDKRRSVRAVFDTLAAFDFGIFPVEGDSENKLENDERGDNTQDAERVGDGVAEGDGGVVEVRDVGVRLDSRAETGGIRYRPRENPDHRGHRDIRNIVQNNRDRDRAHNHRHRDQIHTDTRLFEGGEEAGPDLQAYREHEQHETELLEEVQNVPFDAHSEVACDNPDEENPSHPEGNSRDFNAPHEHAQCNHERKNDNAVGDARAEEEIVEPIHNIK